MRTTVSTFEHPSQSDLWTLTFSSRRRAGALYPNLLDLIYCLSYASQPFLCKFFPNCTRSGYGGGANVYSLGRRGEGAPSAQP